MTPTFGSLFAGIGGFDLGLERAGWRCAWQVESDPACRSVLRRHFPGVPIYEDVREVGDELEAVDLVCGGFPCQDVSVAGKRAGLAGARSGLWWEFHRIVSLLSPPWVLVENVAGLLSSHGGRDLGAIIGGLANLGYVGIWRVLDSQFFGVAQRRRRVFLVGHLGAEPRPEVLSLAEGVSGHPPPSREAGARVAGGAEGGAGDEGERVTAYSLRSDAARSGEAKTPSPDAEGRVRLRDPGFNVCDDFAPTLDAGAAPSVVAAQCHGSNVGPMGTLRQGNGGLTGGVPFVAAPQVYSDSGQSHWREGEPSLSVSDDNGTNQVVAYRASDYTSGAYEEVEQAGPLTTSADRTRSAPVAIQDGRGMDKAQNGRGWSDDGVSYTIDGTGAQSVATATPRRLTPQECERLQGFPDGWTDGQSDSARYRQLGNAVTVPVSEWLGRRILAAHREATG